MKKSGTLTGKGRKLECECLCMVLSWKKEMGERRLKPLNFSHFPFKLQTKSVRQVPQFPFFFFFFFFGATLFANLARKLHRRFRFYLFFQPLDCGPQII